jgi:hypothetical protein
MDTQYTIGYTPNSFYWVSAQDDVPSVAACNSREITNMNDRSCNPVTTRGKDFEDNALSCIVGNSDNITSFSTCIKSKSTYGIASDQYILDSYNWVVWRDNSMNCYKKELCKNRENAGKLDKLLTNHLGTDENISNFEKIYDNHYVQTTWLVIGIVGLSLLAYTMKK